MASKGGKKNNWSLDFTKRHDKDPSYIALRSGKDVSQTGERDSLPGYNPSLSLSHGEIAKESDAHSLIVKKSWDVALGPMKQVPMNLFIMYMAGNSISIFPIMMVGMLFLRPVKALLSIQNTFRMIEGGHAIAQKFVYLVGNLACIALALYKCQSMGLLPTHASDWLEFVEAQKRVEYSGGGLLL